MKVSPTTLVRGYMTITGKGRHMFSDKTTFGRSIKVWGFEDNDYEECKKILRKHGYIVRFVQTYTGRTRLWVYM